MKQNGVVCKPGLTLLLFIFRFEYLISGPKSYPDFRETGLWTAERLLAQFLGLDHINTQCRTCTYTTPLKWLNLSFTSLWNDHIEIVVRFPGLQKNDEFPSIMCLGA